MSQSESPAPPASEPVGIGGWLLLPMLGLVLAPLAGVLAVVAYVDVLPVWPVLNFPQQVLFVGELIGSICLTFIAPAILLVLMYKWREEFPAWYVVWAAAFPLFQLVDALLVYAAFREAHPAGLADAFDNETVRGIVRSTVSAAIWIPYMMYSQRVENTFVK